VDCGAIDCSSRILEGGGLLTDVTFDQESAFVELAYSRLDEVKSLLRKSVAGVLDGGRGGTHQARLERDILVESNLSRLSHFELGEHALVFARVDFSQDSPDHPGATYHIGRVSLDDSSGEVLVVDWRAPVAEAFYRATARVPMGLQGRAHLFVERGHLVRLEREPFRAGDDNADGLYGPTALYVAISRPRTDEMADIVSTIQAEQDELIRRPFGTATIVEGSPGTGKTAVALHRAAYLAYTYRWRLERQGILVVGPSPNFVRYVGAVLPSLGESGVELRSLAGLRVSDAKRGPTEPKEILRVKGDVAMARVLARAVRDRQRSLPHERGFPFGAGFLTVSQELSERAIALGRSAKGPHNPRQPLVERFVAEELATQFLERRSRGAQFEQIPVDPDEDAEQAREDLIFQIRSQEGFQRIMTRIWPRLRSEELLFDLFSHRPLLALATKGILSDSDRDGLLLPRESRLEDYQFSAADAFLLDELDRLLGNGTPQVYGYVIVDEAQDISPMAARALRRRISGSSVMLLGDRAQATGPFSGRDWEAIIEPLHLKGVERLNLGVNYRSPREVVELSSRLRQMIGFAETEVALRESGQPVKVISCDESEMLQRVVREIGSCTAEVPGTLAVVVPDHWMHGTNGFAQSILTASKPFGRITVSDVAGIKGMEFDSVVVVQPDNLCDGDAALGNLYVAITRSTQRLVMIVGKRTRTWFQEWVVGKGVVND